MYPDHLYWCELISETNTIIYLSLVVGQRLLWHPQINHIWWQVQHQPFRIE